MTTEERTNLCLARELLDTALDRLDGYVAMGNLGDKDYAKGSVWRIADALGYINKAFDTERDIRTARGNIMNVTIGGK